VIFDFDGVLVDSESAHFEAFRTALATEVEGEVTQTEYDKHYLGFDDHTCVRRALELRGRTASPDVVIDLVDRKWQAYDRELSRIPFFPGAPDLVLELYAASIPLAIASGSHRNEIESILGARGLLQCFRGVISADDVSNYKPHPEPYLRARALLGAIDSPAAVVAIEDSTTGMAAARAAGLGVIGVTNSRPREKLGLAHHVVDSLVGLSVEGIARVARESGTADDGTSST
jgi:beta-phosphoglucomutase-like phosphatase (HAD superfamily)